MYGVCIVCTSSSCTLLLWSRLYSILITIFIHHLYGCFGTSSPNPPSLKESRPDTPRTVRVNGAPSSAIIATTPFLRILRLTPGVVNGRQEIVLKGVALPVPRLPVVCDVSRLVCQGIICIRDLGCGSTPNYGFPHTIIYPSKHVSPGMI